jgi:ABC-2 type transport system ATP-binding protein
LDEPTAGVDPIGRRVIRDVIADARSRGVAVLVCTHDLADVEAACDSAVVLAKGTVRARGSVAALTAGGTSFTSAAGLDARALSRAARCEVREAAPGDYACAGTLDAAATAALAAELAAQGASLGSLRQGASLEDRYVELVGRDAIDATSAAAAPRAARRRGRR